LKGYKLKVDEIAPAAEAMPRLGNIFRARAKFPTAPRDIKVGMKGVGKISTAPTNLWFVIKRGVLIRWTRLSIYF